MNTKTHLKHNGQVKHENIQPWNSEPGRQILPYWQLKPGRRLSVWSICLQDLCVLSLMGWAIRLLWLLERKEVVTQDVNGELSIPFCHCQGADYKPVQKTVCTGCWWEVWGREMHEAVILPECRRAEKPCSSSQSQAGSLSLSTTWKGGASLCQVTSELLGERETVSLPPGTSGKQGHASSECNMTACLGDVKHKGQFWKVNRFSVVRVGHKPFWV